MSKINKVQKLNLDILKELSKELDASIEKAELIKADDKSEVAEFVVEMSKSAGLIYGIMQESTMLIADVNSLIKESQMVSSKETNFLDKIFGDLKNPGKSTN